MELPISESSSSHGLLTAQSESDAHIKLSNSDKNKKRDFKIPKKQNLFSRSLSIAPELKIEKISIPKTPAGEINISSSVVDLESQSVSEVKVKGVKTFIPTLENLAKVSDIPSKVEISPAKITNSEEFKIIFKSEDKELMSRVIKSNNLIGYGNKFSGIEYYSLLHNGHRVKVNIFQYVVEKYCQAFRREQTKKQIETCDFCEFVIKELITHNYLTTKYLNSLSPLLGKWYRDNSKNKARLNPSPLQHLLDLPQYNQRTIDLVNWLIAHPNKNVTLDIDKTPKENIKDYVKNKSAIPFLSEKILEVDKFCIANNLILNEKDFNKYNQQINFLFSLLEYHLYDPDQEYRNIENVIDIFELRSFRKFEKIHHNGLIIQNLKKLKSILESKPIKFLEKNKLSKKDKDTYIRNYSILISNIKGFIRRLEAESLLDKLYQNEGLKDFELKEKLSKLIIKEKLKSIEYGFVKNYIYGYWDKLPMKSDTSEKRKALTQLVNQAESLAEKKRAIKIQEENKKEKYEAALAIIAKNNNKNKN